MPVDAHACILLSPATHDPEPDSGAVLPDSEAVLPDSEAVLPDSEAVLPDSEAVLLASFGVSEPGGPFSAFFQIEFAMLLCASACAWAEGEGPDGAWSGGDEGEKPAVLIVCMCVCMCGHVCVHVCMRGLSESVKTWQRG
jgi:hypothetical protein